MMRSESSKTTASQVRRINATAGWRLWKLLILSISLIVATLATQATAFCQINTATL